ncbi:MAG: hypothetical protein JKY46_06700 [Robiginitomaculum sp.]|nr:hypothetical protein [Robiginitomaculum sp.]
MSKRRNVGVGRYPALHLMGVMVGELDHPNKSCDDGLGGIAPLRSFALATLPALRAW